MSSPVPITPQGVADAIQALLDENDALKQKISKMEGTFGQTVFGTRPNRPKLTKNDVKRVREMKRNGCTQADIADCFDVNPATISRIVRGIYH